jgi:hypothetical protein
LVKFELVEGAVGVKIAIDLETEENVVVIVLVLVSEGTARDHAPVLLSDLEIMVEVDATVIEAVIVVLVIVIAMFDIVRDRVCLEIEHRL